MFLERVSKLEIKEELQKRTVNAVSHLGMSAYLRKLSQNNSVTYVRNTEELIQPIILGIERSTRKV